MTGARRAPDGISIPQAARARTRENTSWEFPKKTTPIPEWFIERVMPLCSGGEVKAFLYICRRTWGFQKDDDGVSLDQLTHGIQRKDGSFKDYGTGSDRKTNVSALRGLVQKNVIDRVPGRGNIPDTYRVRRTGPADHKETETESETPERSSRYAKRLKNLQKGRQKSPVGAVENFHCSPVENFHHGAVENFHPQYTVQETVQETGIPEQSSSLEHCVDPQQANAKRITGDESQKPAIRAPGSTLGACDHAAEKNKVDHPASQPAAQIHVSDWPATVRAIREPFAAWTGDGKIAEIIAAALEVEPAITDSQLSEVVPCARTATQKTAGLFKKTIPECLRAARNGSARSIGKSGNYLACAHCGGARKPTGDLLDTTPEFRAAAQLGWTVCYCHGEMNAGEEETAKTQISDGPMNTRFPQIAATATATQQERLRALLRAYMGEEPPDGFEQSCVLRARGATVADICDLLERKYAKKKYGPTGKNGPHKWAWFLTVIGNEFSPNERDRFPEAVSRPAPEHFVSSEALARGIEALEQNDPEDSLVSSYHCKCGAEILQYVSRVVGVCTCQAKRAVGKETAAAGIRTTVARAAVGK